MVRLVPMTEDEYRDYMSSAVGEYAQEVAQANDWPIERALQVAEEQFRELLPQGLSTLHHRFLVIEESAPPAGRVGMLWFAVEHKGPKPHAFLYDFRIDEAFRRRGYGTQALQALEVQVRKLGLDTITLHVFGHNSAARALYKKMGYAEVDLIMSKMLDEEKDAT